MGNSLGAEETFKDSVVRLLGLFVVAAVGGEVLIEMAHDQLTMAPLQLDLL